MSVSSPIGKYSSRKFFESNELGQKLFKSFPKISWLNCKGFDFRIVLRLSSTVLNCPQSLHMCTHGYTYTYTYIWVVFPRTGKMSKICPNFFFFGALLWPNGFIFSSFLNCSEEFLSVRVNICQILLLANTDLSLKWYNSASRWAREVPKKRKIIRI